MANLAFARQLKTLRRQKGLNQAEVARGARIDQANYSKIERGLSTPRSSTIDAIVRALGLDEDAVEAKILRSARNQDSVAAAHPTGENGSSLVDDSAWNRLRPDSLEPPGNFEREYALGVGRWRRAKELIPSDLDRARTLLRDAIDGMRGAQAGSSETQKKLSLELMYRLHFELAVVCDWLGDEAQTIAEHRLELQAAIEQADVGTAAMAMHNLGDTYAEYGKWIEGEAFLRASLGMKKEMGMPYSNTLGELAVLHAQQGGDNLPRAVLEAEEAVNRLTYGRVSEPYASGAYSARAFVNARLKNFERANLDFETALGHVNREASQGFFRIFSKAAMLLNWAESSLVEGNLIRAEQLLSESQSLNPKSETVVGTQEAIAACLMHRSGRGRDASRALAHALRRFAAAKARYKHAHYRLLAINTGVALAKDVRIELLDVAYELGRLGARDEADMASKLAVQVPEGAGNALPLPDLEQLRGLASKHQ